MTAVPTDAEKEAKLEKIQAAAVRPIDQEPLYIQLQERFDRLYGRTEMIFLEELNEALRTKYVEWKDALEDIADRVKVDNSKGEADANAELIKSNELLDTLMKRAESEWAYLHTRIKGLKCLKEGTWKEATDEIYAEISFLQTRVKDLAVENGKLMDQLDSAGLSSPGNFEDANERSMQEEGLDTQPSKQRAEGEPPAPCGAVESEDPSKSEPTKEKLPEQARRAAQGDPSPDDPFYKVVGVAMQAYPLVRELGKILRGKRDT